MNVQSTGEATEQLRDWSSGDPEALSRLMPLVVADLSRLAGHFFRGERAGHTLEPSALVSEVYVRLSSRPAPELRWETRVQFFAFAGRMMRNLLISHARRKKAARHGGKIVRLSLTAAEEVPQSTEFDINLLLDLHRALRRFEKIDPQASRIVELRFFAGLTVRDTARALDICESEVGRDWEVAKRWLARQLKGEALGKALKDIV